MAFAEWRAQSPRQLESLRRVHTINSGRYEEQMDGSAGGEYAAGSAAALRMRNKACDRIRI